ncbi:McrB family protein [Phascolarctobacterium faecium]|uniref:McrB family protein n=1 Tax=Phascolarctobacterium faecium TaxID=33025 RepID=UPI003FD8AB7F
MGNERWEVNYNGELVWQAAATSSKNRGTEKIELIKKLFERDGWTCEILDDSSKFIKIQLVKENVDTPIIYHIALVNVVNEYRANSDNPDSNSSYEKRIQGQDFSELQYNNKLIFGLYVIDSEEDLEKSIIVSWPEEVLTSGSNRAYRVNTKVNIQPARQVGLYADKNSAYNVVTFRPEYVHGYLKNREILHRYEKTISDGDANILPVEEQNRKLDGRNILLYGVPGSGKSWTIEHEYCSEDSVVDRLVFHPDYTNADFIGQILPVVDEEKQVTYEFTPGPFTTILSNAYHNPMQKYILIIEEINRGNAPAIFGEVFQLLDRKVEMQDGDDGFPVGTSEYGITHKYMADFIYGNPAHKVRIPSNLSIIGTMNTSDQNVFTLDTAFQRRWRMRLIENNFDNVRPSLADAEILDTDVTWKRFCETVNTIIIGNKAKMASAEDKRLGVYFVHENDLKFDSRALPSEGNATLLVEYNSLLGYERLGTITEEQKSRLKEIREAVMQNRLFPEKVIKYLWDDAFKFNPEALFDTDGMDNLEKVIRTFIYSTGHDRFKIFKQTVRDTLYTAQQ